VIIGAQVSSRAKDSLIRPALVVVLTLSALKLLGVSNAALGAVLVASLVTGVVSFFVSRWRRVRAAEPDEPAPPALAQSSARRP
jgi:hypothetical protein